jgi:hypothetical protein
MVPFNSQAPPASTQALLISARAGFPFHAQAAARLEAEDVPRVTHFRTKGVAPDDDLGRLLRRHSDGALLRRLTVECDCRLGRVPGRNDGACSGVRKHGFDYVVQMFWPAVAFWLASPFMTSCPLTASWRAAQAGPGPPAAPWAGRSTRALRSAWSLGSQGPGSPSACRCAEVIRRIVGASRARSGYVKSDRLDPADPAHPAPSRPSITRGPDCRELMAGVRKVDDRRNLWVGGRLSRRQRRRATVTGGTDEPRRRPPAARQR